MTCSQSIPPPNSNENFNYCILCKQKQSYTEMLWISFFNTTRQIAGWWKTVLLSVKESIGNLFFFHQRARKNKTHLTLKSDKIVASNFSLYKGHDNKGQDKQLKKFSLSAPYEMYRKQYGEYAN